MLFYGALFLTVSKWLFYRLEWAVVGWCFKHHQFGNPGGCALPRLIEMLSSSMSQPLSQRERNESWLPISPANHCQEPQFKAAAMC